MRHRRLIPALALLPALLLGCGEPPAEEAADASAPDAAMASDDAAIAALADYWETHYNMQHADMVASTYTEDAWVAPADGGMFEGRPAIEGWLTGNMEAAPTVEITPAETVVAGDVAVSMGTYAISAAPEGAEPMRFSGAYMNALEKVDGEWKIAGTISNYDAPPPDDNQWNAPPDGDTPPDAPMYPELIDAYEAAFNAGDAAAIAALYADDAKVALSNGSLLEGPAAVELDMAARITPGATIEIHEVGGYDLGAGLSARGGWYQIAGPDGAPAQTGFWMNVLRAQDDGTPEIAWSITNARPGGM